MPCLISTSGHLLEFRKFPSRFGTYTDNELVVQDGLGGLGHHFTLRREGVRIVIEATPKAVTAVNGNDVRRANIRDGDRIRVGQLMLIHSNPSGQQNHLVGRLDAEKPVALPAPEAWVLPAPATSRHTLPPTSASPTSGQKTTSSARGALQSPQIATHSLPKRKYTLPIDPSSITRALSIRTARNGINSQDTNSINLEHADTGCF